MRIIIAIIFIAIAAVLIGEAIYGVLPPRWSDLLLNLGTELIGIVLTVGIIDHLLERRKNQEDARRIALEALHDIDHHVWVWQGGARIFNVGELVELLRGVRADDPFPTFTQNLFLLVGSKASNTLRTKAVLLKSSPTLKAALEHLCCLTEIRDGHLDIEPKIVADHLMSSVDLLLKVAELSLPKEKIGGESDQYKACSLQHQEWRHFGKPMPQAPSIA